RHLLHQGIDLVEAEHVARATVGSQCSGTQADDAHASRRPRTAQTYGQTCARVMRVVGRRRVPQIAFEPLGAMLDRAVVKMSDPIGAALRFGDAQSTVEIASPDDGLSPIVVNVSGGSGAQSQG